MASFKVPDTKSEIKDIFALHFKSKGLNLMSHITNSVWFLDPMNNGKLQSIQREKNARSIMLESLERLNKEGNKKKNGKDFCIFVESFINFFVDNFLYDYKKRILESDKAIKDYNISYYLKAIPDVIAKLKEKKTKSPSNLTVSINRLQNFPISDYTFDLKIIYEDHTEKGLPLHIKVDKEGISSYKDEVYDKIEFTSSLTPEDPNNESSGSTLLSFNLEIKKNGDKYMITPNKKFVYYFVNEIEQLTNIDNKKVITNIELEKDNKHVFCLFDFDLDNQTRISILNKIKFHFQVILDQRIGYTNVVSDILHYYFPEIADNVITLLQDKKIEERGQCCNDCIIF